MNKTLNEAVMAVLARKQPTVNEEIEQFIHGTSDPVKTIEEENEKNLVLEGHKQDLAAAYKKSEKLLTRLKAWHDRYHEIDPNDTAEMQRHIKNHPDSYIRSDMGEVAKEMKRRQTLKDPKGKLWLRGDRYGMVKGKWFKSTDVEGMRAHKKAVGRHRW